MKIAVISICDFAASGLQIANAVNHVGQHEARCITGYRYTKFDYASDIDLNHGQDAAKVSAAQKIVDEADIIHYKGDWLLYDNLYGVRIPQDRPRVATLGGGIFRHTQDEWSPILAQTFDARTVQTADLLHPDLKGDWVPHTYQRADTEFRWHCSHPAVVGHIASNPLVKTSVSTFEPAMVILGHAVKPVWPTGISHQESVSLKADCTFYFDQAGYSFVSQGLRQQFGFDRPGWRPLPVGFYGNAAVEAMSWGVPTIAHISATARDRAMDALDACPVLDPGLDDLDGLVQVLRPLLDDDYRASRIAETTWRWYNDTHSYKAVGTMYSRIYDRIG